MARINAILDRIIVYIVGASLAGLVGISFAQVIARYVFNASFSWVEEVSMIILLWGTWFGACLALRDSAHLRVIFLVEKLEPKTEIILRISLNCLVVLFFATIAYTGKLTISAMANIDFMSLSIPQNVIYWSVPSGCALLIYYTIRSMVEDWQRLGMMTREKKE